MRSCLECRERSWRCRAFRRTLSASFWLWRQREKTPKLGVAWDCLARCDFEAESHTCWSHQGSVCVTSFGPSGQVQSSWPQVAENLLFVKGPDTLSSKNNRRQSSSEVAVALLQHMTCHALTRLEILGVSEYRWDQEAKRLDIRKALQHVWLVWGPYRFES